MNNIMTETSEAEASGDIAFTISDRAARRINEITADEPVNKILRLGVLGGGCSGFQYSFDLVPQPQDDDVAIEHQGATVVIDAASLPLLAGSQLDYIDDLIGSMFQVKNPNATSSCGCGTSFGL